MFTELQNELKNYRGDPVIVEGKLDKKVLNRIGFENVLDISGKPLNKIVERVASNESVIILTDYDEDGNKKASALTKMFQSVGVKINFFARRRFKALFKIQKIEEINSFVKLMEDDCYGQTCSIYDKIFNRSRVLRRRSCREARCNRRNIRSNGGAVGRRS